MSPVSGARRVDSHLHWRGTETPAYLVVPGSCPAREEVSMGHVRLSEHINAPINQVWDLNADCERVPEWNVTTVEIKDCQGRLDRVGGKTTTVGRGMGRKIEGTGGATKAGKPDAFAPKIPGAGGAKGNGY